MVFSLDSDKKICDAFSVTMNIIYSTTLAAHVNINKKGSERSS